MPRLIVTNKEYTYRGRHMFPGEIFEADERNAKILIGIRAAALAPIEMPKPPRIRATQPPPARQAAPEPAPPKAPMAAEPEPAQAPETPSKMAPIATGTYSRRDLRAQD